MFVSMDSTKHILITGANGFASSHLVPLLKKKGYGNIFGLSIEKDSSIIEPKAYRQCDILDYELLKKTIAETEPEIIFHFAAILRNTPKIPVKTMEVNFNGTLNLLEAIREVGIEPIVHVSGSSLQYGNVKETELPVKEDTPFNPYTPYGSSKAAAELLAIQYHKLYGLNVIITRAFNHVGPGMQGKALVCSEWSKRIAEIEKGKEKELMVGNLEIERDFLDIRDIVNAYLVAVEKCGFGTPYNVCSGKPTKLETILVELKSMARTEIKAKSDGKKLNGIEPLKLYGDNSKFKKKTGWKQKIPLKQSLEDTLNFWRENS